MTARNIITDYKQSINAERNKAIGLQRFVIHCKNDEDAAYYQTQIDKYDYQLEILASLLLTMDEEGVE